MTRCAIWQGREVHPTAACLDSQSVKTTALAGEKGYDPATKSNGASVFTGGHHGLGARRSRYTASVQDRDGAKLVFQAVSYSCKHLRLV